MMDTKRKVLINLLILAILIFSFYIATKFISKTTGMVVFGEDSDTIRCIGENAVLYGIEGCSYCQIQKKEFGSSFEDINYLDCEKDIELCKGLKEIPAWKIGDEVYYGMKSIEELRILTKC